MWIINIIVAFRNVLNEYDDLLHREYRFLIGNKLLKDKFINMQ